MAKIILTNGVLNVEESYDQILKKERKGDWIELIEDNQEMKHRYKAMGIEADYRVSININHIQCIKP
jgi:uncharacterized membrane-anchored protein